MNKTRKTSYIAMALCLTVAQVTPSGSSSSSQSPSLVKANPNALASGAYLAGSKAPDPIRPRNIRISQVSRRAWAQAWENSTNFADKDSIIFGATVAAYLSATVPLSLSGEPGTLRLLAPGQDLPHVPEEAPNWGTWDNMSYADRQNMFPRDYFDLRLSDELSTMLDNHPNLRDSVISTVYKEFGLSLDLRFMTSSRLKKKADAWHLTGDLPMAKGSVIPICHAPMGTNGQKCYLLPDQKLGLDKLLEQGDDGSYRFNLSPENQDNLKTFMRELSKDFGFEEELEIIWKDTRRINMSDSETFPLCGTLALYSLTENGGLKLCVAAPERLRGPVEITKSRITKKSLQQNFPDLLEDVRYRDARRRLDRMGESSGE